jgi:hypothetical protein
MQGAVINMELTIEDEATAMLARLMYIHFQEHRSKTPRPAPFAPEWAYDYARIAVGYLGVDDEGIDSLREDYR